MWQQLITKIEATLDEVELVKDYSTTPREKIDKAPFVFFKPAGMQNSFETNSENMQTYRFLMIVIVPAGGTTIENAFGSTLPKVVDQLIEAFDAGWNAGTIDGHRVRIKIDSQDEWQIDEDEKGATAWAPLALDVRLLKNV